VTLHLSAILFSIKDNSCTLATLHASVLQQYPLQISIKNMKPMHHSRKNQYSKLTFTVSATLLSLCCLLYSCTYRPVAPIDPNLILDDFAKTIDGGDPRGMYTPNKPFRFISIAKFAPQRRGDSIFNQTWASMTDFVGVGTVTLSGESTSKGTYMTKEFWFGSSHFGDSSVNGRPNKYWGLFCDIFVMGAPDTGKPTDILRVMPILDVGVRIPFVPKQPSGTWEVQNKKLIFDGDTTNAVSFTANGKALFFLSVFPDTLYHGAGYEARGNSILSAAFRRTN
jgi:hypothetical protein